MDNRNRLGDAVRQRREALGLSTSAAAVQANMARQTWMGVETATRNTYGHVLTKVDIALKWPIGTANQILNGAEPPPVEED